MSEIKVNKISPRSGTTVTLGDSGDTFTIPSGATINNQGTATNFGATGSASWVTTVKTNSDSGFTATAGEGYFLNTTAGTISVNLPAGSAGAVVAFKDYAGTWDNNNATLVPNGSDKIGGIALNATLDTEGAAVTLVFVDSTQGWLVTDDGLQTSASTAQYVAATGGNTVLTSGNFKIHTFTSPGTFCVSCAGNAAGSNSVDYLVIAGGGGGGGGADPSGVGSAGGGAGGYRFTDGTVSGCYAAGPAPLGASALPVSATAFPITVGAGGAGSVRRSTNEPQGNNGANSIFSSITSAGGGGGAARSPGSPNAPQTGVAGGSGGGSILSNTGAAGNTPPVSPPQGNQGGRTCGSLGGPSGGGGAGAVGASIGSGPSSGGAGGAGLTSCITASPVARGGGGGGATSCGGSGGGAAGSGGGGAGGAGYQGTGAAATVNTGGGGGGSSGGNGSTANAGGNGGSGIVVIRYKFQ